MIVHKTFTEQTTSWKGQSTLDKQENVREDAQKFIADQIAEEDIISIAETAMTSNGLFSVTVWYKQQ